MNLNRETSKRILMILSCCILLIFALYNYKAVAAAAGKLIAILTPLLLGLCFAFVMNVLLRPIEELWGKIRVKKYERKLERLKRPVCLLLTTAILLGAIFILLFMIIPELKKTIESVITAFPFFVEQLETWITKLSLPGQQGGGLLPDFSLESMGEALQNFFQNKGSSFFSKTMDITTSIFGGVVDVILGLAFSFYILAQKEKLAGQVRRLMNAFLPQKTGKKLTELAELTYRVFTNFITGQLMEAVIIGILCFAGMCILAIPHAAMISVLVGFTALIPIFGAFIGTAIGAFLICMVNPMKALWFVLFIIVLQQLEGNLIYPKVVGKSIGLPGIWVLAAVTIGASAGGILGMLLSVPVSSVLYALLRQEVNRRLENTPAETK